MTVKELIQELLQCPLNAEVHIYCYYEKDKLENCYVKETPGPGKNKIVILEN